MKKNLRIVSAAAAALLAVAPIAAAAAPVNAAPVNNIELGGTNAGTVKGDIDVTSHVTASTKPDQTVINNVTGQVSHYNWDGSLSGTISAAFGGSNYTANLNPAATDNSKVILYRVARAGETGSKNIAGLKLIQMHKENGIYDLEPAGSYYVQVDNIGFNFGTANANRNNLRVTSSNGVKFFNATTRKWTSSTTVNTDQNGAAREKLTVMLPISPVDVTNGRSVAFYEKSSGNEVQNGTLSLTANGTHQLNVNAVLGAAKAKYAAHQLESDNNYNAVSVSTTAADLTSELKKENINVDANGNFDAPASFTMTLNAKSAVNNAIASLPITVSVANAKAAATPAQETGVSKTIMHVAQYYDNKGNKTTLNGQSEVHAYDTVSVVANPVTINGARYYKIANQNAYIKVGNIDGTSRTLSHNAYIYKRTSSGRFVARTHRVHKKTRHIVVRKGESRTTYGSALYGKKYYRIGRNQYIKVANFR